MIGLFSYLVWWPHFVFISATTTLALQTYRNLTFSSLVSLSPNSMASSLQQLLADEGFQHTKTPKLNDKQDIPIYIFHDRRSSTSASASTSKKNMTKTDSVQVQPDIDQVAISKAVVTILSSCVGRYLKDLTFRQSVKHNFSSCFQTKNNNNHNNPDGRLLIAKLELGIQSVDKFVEGPDASGTHILKDSIKLLTLVASLNSQQSRNRSTCGIPNSFLSASAQFYIAVVYKIQKNDRICARHLLQVFCDSSRMARTRLLPHLWEQFFLPHLLHIKVWYSNELQLVLSSDESCDKERMRNSLCKVYNDQMDWGTSQFAFYYKQLLKVGATDPALPFVPLPACPGYSLSRTTSSCAVGSNSTAKRSL